jgi:hypothetical protein
MNCLEHMFTGGQIYYTNISVDKKSSVLPGSYNYKLVETSLHYPHLLVALREWFSEKGYYL